MKEMYFNQKSMSSTYGYFPRDLLMNPRAIRMDKGVQDDFDNKNEKGPAIFKCFYCIKRFSTQTLMFKHLTLQHNNEDVQKKPKKTTKNNIGKSKNVNNEEENLEAKVLKKNWWKWTEKFKTAHKLEQHLVESHNFTATFTWEVCSAPFFRKNAYYQHNRRHIKMKENSKVSKDEKEKEENLKVEDENYSKISKLIRDLDSPSKSGPMIKKRDKNTINDRCKGKVKKWGKIEKTDDRDNDNIHDGQKISKVKDTKSVSKKNWKKEFKSLMEWAIKDREDTQSSSKVDPTKLLKSSDEKSSQNDEEINDEESETSDVNIKEEKWNWKYEDMLPLAQFNSEINKLDNYMSLNGYSNCLNIEYLRILNLIEN